MYGQPVFWRESMKPAKFLIFDSKVVMVVLPCFLHMRPWTLFLAIATMMTFWWFDRKGIAADSILRFLRARIVGKKRTARGVFEERLPADYGFECQGYLQRWAFEQAKAEAAAAGKPQKSFNPNPFTWFSKPPAQPEQAVNEAAPAIDLSKAEEAVEHEPVASASPAKASKGFNPNPFTWFSKSSGGS